MKSKNPLFVSLFIIAMVVTIVFLARQMLDEGRIPPLQKFLDENSGYFSSSTVPLATQPSIISIYAPSSTISVLVAADDTSREQGLSGVAFMNENDGMLFVFDKPQIPGFWMKNMNFPLDIVWIDQNKKVVSISEDIATSTYPKAFSPKSPISYVLEINAGTVRKFGISVGAKLNFDLPK
jgi:uncharacterized membrane protein (UPF0127 family)